MVRDVQGVGDNLLDFSTVKKNIENVLSSFGERVKITLLNITNICYGRV